MERAAWIFILFYFFASLQQAATYSHDGRREGDITEIPDDIPLDETDIRITYTSITTLSPRAFSRFSKLSELRLHDNNISVVADSAFADTAITELYLRDNMLETPPDLSAISASLRNLWMRNNRLTSFPPEYFSQMKNLKGLGLADNQLTNVPRLQGLQLDELWPHNNSIELRPGDFLNVSVKGWLSLNNNKISDVTPLFDLANSPETLYLHGNDLSKVTAADLQHLIQGSLKYLHVHNCNLTTFPDIRHSDLDRITYREQDNDFYCDCRLWWATEMDGLASPGLAEWTCAHPASLRGERILDVSVGEFCPGKTKKFIQYSSVLFLCIIVTVWVIRLHHLVDEAEAIELIDSDCNSIIIYFRKSQIICSMIEMTNGVLQYLILVYCDSFFTIVERAHYI
jgi:hypothetical protein